MLVVGETKYRQDLLRLLQQALPAAELTFTSGGWWRQRGNLLLRAWRVEHDVPGRQKS